MSMPQIISISGSVHSGKSSVSRRLALKFPNHLYLDGDLIGASIWQEGVDFDKEFLPKAFDRITEIIKANIERDNSIIIDYPLTDKNRENILKSIEELQYEVFWFLLKPDIEKVLARSETRPELNEWEIERIEYHYNSELMNTKLARVINSTNQTPDETADEIYEIILKEQK